MPTYERDGNPICFFQHRKTFKARYSVRGFTDKARLDNGMICPISCAILSLSDEVESILKELIRRTINVS